MSGLEHANDDGLHTYNLCLILIMQRSHGRSGQNGHPSQILQSEARRHFDQKLAIQRST